MTSERRSNSRSMRRSPPSIVAVASPPVTVLREGWRKAWRTRNFRGAWTGSKTRNSCRLFCRRDLCPTAAIMLGVGSAIASQTTARAARAASSKPLTEATPSIEMWSRRLLRIASTVFSSNSWLMMVPWSGRHGLRPVWCKKAAHPVEGRTRPGLGTSPRGLEVEREHREEDYNLSRFRIKMARKTRSTLATCARRVSRSASAASTRS